MASLSLYPQFEANLMSNHNVIELLLKLKSAKAHGKNYIRVKAHLVRHLLRNSLLDEKCFYRVSQKKVHKFKIIHLGSENRQIANFSVIC